MQSQQLAKTLNGIFVTDKEKNIRKLQHRFTKWQSSLAQRQYELAAQQKKMNLMLLGDNKLLPAKVEQARRIKYRLAQFQIECAAEQYNLSELILKLDKMQEKLESSREKSMISIAKLLKIGAHEEGDQVRAEAKNCIKGHEENVSEVTICHKCGKLKGIKDQQVKVDQNVLKECKGSYVPQNEQATGSNEAYDNKYNCHKPKMLPDGKTIDQPAEVARKRREAKINDFMDKKTEKVANFSIDCSKYRDEKNFNKPANEKKQLKKKMSANCNELDYHMIDENQALDNTASTRHKMMGQPTSQNIRKENIGPDCTAKIASYKPNEHIPALSISSYSMTDSEGNITPKVAMEASGSKTYIIRKHNDYDYTEDNSMSSMPHKQMNLQDPMNYFTTEHNAELYKTQYMNNLCSDNGDNRFKQNYAADANEIGYIHNNMGSNYSYVDKQYYKTNMGDGSKCYQNCAADGLGAENNCQGKTVKSGLNHVKFDRQMLIAASLLNPIAALLTL